MVKHMNHPKTVITKKDKLITGSIAIQDLINILIALKIIFEEELENCIETIS